MTTAAALVLAARLLAGAVDVFAVALAFLLLGLLFNFNGLWVNVGWAAAAAFLARRSGLVQRSLRWLDRAAGALFVGFGIRLALTAAPQP